jgi:phosphohistidine phosphatase SixA
MKKKTMLVIRHGDCGSNKKLSQEGVAQIRKAANICRKFFSEEKVKFHDIKIVTSPLLRAVDAALIIATELGVESIETQNWLSGQKPIEAGREIEDLRDRFSQNNLIVISHAPVIEAITGKQLEKGGVIKI